MVLCAISLMTFDIFHDDYAFILVTLSQTPFLGVRMKTLLSNSMGLSDFEHVSNLKFCSSIASPILACIMPKRSPMQTLGPRPNDKKE